MFDSIRKHQSWLWTVIGFLVIISFVWFFLPNANNSGQRGPLVAPVVGGKDVTLRELDQARRQTQLGLILQFGPQVNDQMLKNFIRDVQVYQHLMLDYKFKEYKIEVTPDAMAQVAQERIRQWERHGVRSYDDLIRALRDRGFSADDFNVYAAHEAGVQRLRDLVGVAGKVVTPQSLESQFRRSNEEVTSELVYFSSSNYLASLKVDDKELATYFTNNMATYRIPEKIQVAYAAYPATNYFTEADAEMAKVSDLVQRIEKEYNRRGSNTFTNAQNAVMSPEEAKEKIKSDVRKELALKTARGKAVEFMDKLLEADTKNIATFQKLAAENKLDIVTTPSFVASEPPKDLKDGELIGSEAENLTDEEPFAGPVMGEDAVYVLTVSAKTPSQPQPFEAVKDKVTEAFKKDKSDEAARKAAEDFAAAATQAISQGKTFEATAIEQKLMVAKLGSFSMSTTGTNVAGLPKEVALNELKQAAGELTLNKVSPAEKAESKEGYFVVSVLKRTPVTDEKFKSDFPTYLSRMRSRAESQAYNEWVNAEFLKWLKEQPQVIQEHIMGPASERG